MKKFILTMVALAIFAVDICATSTFGYCNGELGRTNMFRMGNTEKQGLAIRLSHEKLQALKGVNINGIELAVGSRNTNNKTITIFISKKLNGCTSDDYIWQTTVTPSKAITWLQYDVTTVTPYTITGEEEELFVGYYMEIGTTYKALMSDFTSDVEGCCYAYNNGEWSDIYGNGYGAACIRLLTSDYQSTDLAIKAGSIEGYFKVGNDYSYSGQIINLGTKTVNSFDLTVSVDGNESTVNYKDLSLAQGNTFDYTINGLKSDNTGNKNVSAAISNINGGNDSDASDNKFQSSMFFYPANMEKCEFVEGFTGQSCPNCPTGHVNINNALAESTAKVVEVMHHSGYSPDIFTTDEDLDYTIFFGSNSTYAPAIMVNRTTLSAIGSVPVFNTSKEYIVWALEQMGNKQPYASLKLNTTYNKDTREATVDFTAYIHNDLPGDNNLINVILTQDNLIAKQSNGSSSYNHSHVFRQTLTGNVWGLLISADNAKAGDSIKWSSTFTLPESYTASAWTNDMLTQSGYTKDDITTAVVADDINVVAYIGGYKANDYLGHEVYNCIEAKLGDNVEHGSGILDISNDRQNIGISVCDGKINVAGGYTYYIYNMAGKQMSQCSTLPQGMYIVKVINQGKAFTKKVIVK